MKPLVGVAGEHLVVHKHFGDQQVVASPWALVAGVRAAGGTPVVLPPGSTGSDLLALDALLLAGGVDLGVDPGRDRDELGLAEAARLAGLPTLGICRGLQVLVVATGGTLVADLGLAHVPLPPTTHPLVTRPGSTIATLVPSGQVGSLHHQAAATHDPRWTCTGTAPDGVVEALEWADRQDWPALAVQWHPELDDTGPAVFSWLVEVASGRRLVESAGRLRDRSAHRGVHRERVRELVDGQ